MEIVPPCTPDALGLQLETVARALRHGLPSARIASGTTDRVQQMSGAAVPHHAVPSGSPLSGALETLEPHDDDVCPMSAGGSDLRKS